MTQILEQVIEALRDELQQFGEMLALLESQQTSLNRGDIGGIAGTAAAIDSQRNVIESARARRENLQKQLAWTVGDPGSQSLQSLLPRTPDIYRPLLLALVGEINQLVEAVRTRLEANQLQLRRALDLTARLLSTISSQAYSALLAEERNSSGAESTPHVVTAAIV